MEFEPATRESNFYDSKYLTEYYDLFEEANCESLDLNCDAPIYLGALEKNLSERSPTPSATDPYVVLDVGTGTGRVLINLARDAAVQGIDLRYVHFIGVDNEPAMVDRAREVSRENVNLSKVGRVLWDFGEAAKLSSADALKDRKEGIDMLLFAVGSISHLAAPDEPQRFFSQVATLLRPGSGFAYIPIQDDFISERSITKRPAVTKTWAQVEEAQDFPSRLYPGLIYKQFPVENSRIEGPIKTDQYRFQIVNSSGEVVENNKIRVQFRVWKETEVVKWVSNAGLDLVETFHTSHETYYVLKKS